MWGAYIQFASFNFQIHLLGVHGDTFQSTYKLNYFQKRKSATGQIELSRQGFGPLTESLCQVSIFIIDIKFILVLRKIKCSRINLFAER